MQSNSEVSELLSKMKVTLVDVLADEPSLPQASREKIASCLSMIEIIFTIFKGYHSPTENFLKPLHAGLSRSAETLANHKPSDGLSNSRSMTNLNEQLGMYDNHNNAEHDDINSLNNLKENYLKVVDDVNNSRKTNEEVINNKPEVNSSQPEVNGARTEMTYTSRPEVENARRRRKRDSSTLFDISLDDLTEPDHSGILEEKHSGKEWWCVLQDQHLCMFPSQNPQELAYDVLLVPCCEISLDDAYTESPVFRLTQVGSTPWVFSAGIERNLRAWIRALCRASGRDDVDGRNFTHSGKSRRNEKKQKKRDMKVFSTTIEEMAEDEQGEEEENEKDKMAEHEQGEEGENEKDETEEMVNGNKKEKTEPRDDKETKDNGSNDEISPCKHKIITTQNLQTKKQAAGKRPQVNLSDDDVEYVVAKRDGFEMNLLYPSSDGKATLSRTLMRRKSTKKRIKLLRWLKKTLFSNDGKDVAVIGDIYKIEEPNANFVKLWCLLRNRDLYCYRSIADKKVELVIPLEGCHVVAGAQDGLKHYPEQFLFCIEVDEKTRHTFVAKSCREMERWMEIVKNKRAMVSLGELSDENDENEGNPGSSSSDDDDEGYCFPLGAEIPSRTSVSYESEASSEGIIDDGGYISVIDIEEEVVRKSRKKKSSKKADKSVLDEKKEQNRDLQQKNYRGPVPLPKSAAYFAGKKKEQNRHEIKIAVEEFPSEENNLQSTDFYDSPEYVKLPLDVTSVNGQHTDVDYSDEKKEESKSVLDSGVVSATNSHGEILKYQLLASSSLPDSPPSQATLGQRNSTEMTGAWRPEVNDKNQFLEIDLGEIISVTSIGIQGRPGYDERGGEFVKSYTLSHSNTRETWSVYKSLGKAKMFQGNSNPENECVKSLKNVTARYIRICPQSWQNHIALRVALYKEQQVNNENNIKIKTNKKKQEKRKSNSHENEKSVTLPTISTTGLEKKKKPALLKKNNSGQIFQNSDSLSITSPDPGSVKEAELVEQVNGSEVPNSEPQSLESRIKLRENLLTKEKKELIIALEGLKKRANYAKDEMIVLSNSNQRKGHAANAEEEYLTANLELVQIKKRLTTIETETRELRLFASQHRELQEEIERPKDFTRPSKPPLLRRASKEIKIVSDIISPPVDKEAFNPEPQIAPTRKVMDNIKIFERLSY